MSEIENNDNPNLTETGTEGTESLLGGDTGQGTDDLSQVFTPEEVAAKKEAVAQAKAEEERRAALTDEERTAEDTAKAEADKNNPNGAPEEYEAFTLPEGVQLDEKMNAEFLPLAKELNLSQMGAQKLADFYASQVLPKIAEQQAEQWEGIKADWAEKAKTDKEFGGDKFGENFEFAKKAMDSFATPELRAAMNEYGFGNHPEVIRLMVRIGKKISEDSTQGPKEQGQGEKRTTFNYDKTT